MKLAFLTFGVLISQISFAKPLPNDEVPHAVVQMPHAVITQMLPIHFREQSNKCYLNVILKESINLLPDESKLISAKDGYSIIGSTRKEKQDFSNITDRCQIDFNKEKITSQTQTIPKGSFFKILVVQENNEHSRSLLGYTINNFYSFGNPILMSCKKAGNSEMTLGDVQSLLAPIALVQMKCPSK